MLPVTPSSSPQGYPLTRGTSPLANVGKKTSRTFRVIQAEIYKEQCLIRATKEQAAEALERQADSATDLSEKVFLYDRAIRSYQDIGPHSDPQIEALNRLRFNSAMNCEKVAKQTTDPQEKVKWLTQAASELDIPTNSEQYIVSRRKFDAIPFKHLEKAAQLWEEAAELALTFDKDAAVNYLFNAAYVMGLCSNANENAKIRASEFFERSAIVLLDRDVPSLSLHEQGTIYRRASGYFNLANLRLTPPLHSPRIEQLKAQTFLYLIKAANCYRQIVEDAQNDTSYNTAEARKQWPANLYCASRFTRDLSERVQLLEEAQSLIITFSQAWHSNSGFNLEEYQRLQLDIETELKRIQKRTN